MKKVYEFYNPFEKKQNNLSKGQNKNQDEQSKLLAQKIRQGYNAKEIAIQNNTNTSNTFSQNFGNPNRQNDCCPKPHFDNFYPPIPPMNNCCPPKPQFDNCFPPFPRPPFNNCCPPFPIPPMNNCCPPKPPFDNCFPPRPPFNNCCPRPLFDNCFPPRPPFNNCCPRPPFDNCCPPRPPIDNCFPPFQNDFESFGMPFEQWCFNTIPSMFWFSFCFPSPCEKRNRKPNCKRKHQSGCNCEERYY